MTRCDNITIDRNFSSSGYEEFSTSSSGPWSTSLNLGSNTNGGATITFYMRVNVTAGIYSAGGAISNLFNVNINDPRDDNGNILHSGNFTFQEPNARSDNGFATYRIFMQ